MHSKNKYAEKEREREKEGVCVRWGWGIVGGGSWLAGHAYTPIRQNVKATWFVTMFREVLRVK